MAFSKWYFGMDGDSNVPPAYPTCGDGPNFYIGRLGGEETAGGGPFILATAALVGARLTSSYWDVSGPGSLTGTAATEWGIGQASAYITAFQAASSYCQGTTLFADIEPKNGGWTNGNSVPNRNVLLGFLSSLSEAGYYPGVYISKDNWDNYFGASYVSPAAFVLWLANAYCGTTCAEAGNSFNSLYDSGAYDRGGYKVMIWQYVTTDCSGETQDLNVTPYTGYQNGHWNPTAS